MRLDRSEDPESVKRRPLQLTPWEQALARDAIKKQAEERKRAEEEQKHAELRNAYYRAMTRAAEKYVRDAEAPSKAEGPPEVIQKNATPIKPEDEHRGRDDAMNAIGILGGAAVNSNSTENKKAELARRDALYKKYLHKNYTSRNKSKPTEELESTEFWAVSPTWFS
jgi:hypothetical protein